MSHEQRGGGHGFDRSYKRGAIMGLTVAEAFILLAFCLLLLFTWWQVDAEQNSVVVAEEERSAILAGLADGSFDAARSLREAGFDLSDSGIVEDLSSYSRFMREEDLRRLMDGLVKLSPETRLSLAEAVEVTGEAALRAKLLEVQGDDITVDQIAERIAKAARQQDDLVNLLNERVGEAIRAAGGSIDTRGTISLPESVLFDPGSHHIKNPRFILQLCSSWVDALHQSGLSLSDLRIEGHASSEGRPADTPDQAYLYNLGLSQLRAQNALSVCLDGVDNPEIEAWTRAHLAAVGYSSTRLIYRPDGTEDRGASRRVMFSVSLNQDRLIDEIKQDVRGDAVLMSANGAARVIDGDTLEIDNTRFRLSGVDAPEMGQMCKNREGAIFDCGEVARRRLEVAVAGKTVSCVAEELDLYRRPIAVCTVEESDLGETMVVEGYAVPYVEFSTQYVGQGEVARAQEVGIWQTEFDFPWDYRRAN